MDGHSHQTSPHKQLVCETQHETVPGSCGPGCLLYTSKWIRSLFPETVFVPFHTNTSQNTEVHIRVNEQGIFASKEVKYLGVHFTRWGRTNQQVAHNARNASRALNVIKVLSAQPWANTSKILVNVVRALMRSRLSYGLGAMPHLSKTGLARLTAIEVRGLRLALGLPQSVPQCLVYREAGLLPFRRYIQLVCSMFLDARLSTTPPSTR